ncbi:OLC1v1015919C1 [Oldenlandia corymbosa var. corymbosa]|uniref:OLC1v1015919C1 n=1 Tax=Oldenlandia corymbosa var. corymbosa TaxID=529605 RepID=A0AAV1E4H5_OLDCO|nr:OLC1v1015919C1 [Oldenlandia corymbosa var. corymbosa]
MRQPRRYKELLSNAKAATADDMAKTAIVEKLKLSRKWKAGSKRRNKDGSGASQVPPNPTAIEQDLVETTTADFPGADTRSQIVAPSSLPIESSSDNSSFGYCSSSGGGSRGESAAEKNARSGVLPIAGDKTSMSQDNVSVEMGLRLERMVGNRMVFVFMLDPNVDVEESLFYHWIVSCNLNAHTKGFCAIHVQRGIQGVEDERIEELEGTIHDLRKLVPCSKKQNNPADIDAILSRSYLEAVLGGLKKVYATVVVRWQRDS